MCFHWCTHLRYGLKLTGSYLIRCAFSGATEPASVSHDRRETVNISRSEHGQRSHMPSGPPGAKELSHWDGPCSGFVCERYGSRRFLGTAPHTCRRTRTAFDEAIVPILSSRQQPVNRSTIATKRLTRPCKCHHLIMVIVSTVTIGLMTYLSVYCHDEQQVRFRKRQQAPLVLKQLYCCLYKIEV